MNNNNLIPLTTEKAREIGRKGGQASGKSKRARRTVADALRLILDEKTAKGAKTTKLDAISAKVIRKMFDNPDVHDLKVLAEILGELKQTINHEGLTLNVTASEEGKANIEQIMEGE